MYPFSTPWKHQKNLRLSDVFRRVEKGCIENEWVKMECPMMYKNPINDFPEYFLMVACMYVWMKLFNVDQIYMNYKK